MSVRRLRPPVPWLGRVVRRIPPPVTLCGPIVFTFAFGTQCVGGLPTQLFSQQCVVLLLLHFDRALDALSHLFAVRTADLEACCGRLRIFRLDRPAPLRGHAGDWSIGEQHPAVGTALLVDHARRVAR